MQSNNIFEFDEVMGTATPVSKGQLIAPNGLCYDNLGGLIILSFAPNANIYTMDLQEGNIEVLVSTNLGQLDGITYDPKRNRYYISAWQQGAIYIFDSSFMDPPEVLLDGLNGPADIYYDEIHDVLVIPEMNTGRIIFYNFNETNVKENLTQLISIYPNPASNYIEIRKPSEGFAPSEGSEIKIYNTYGECVLTLETKEFSSLQRIDISHLPVGLYFIQIGNYLEKFMVVR